MIKYYLERIGRHGFFLSIVVLLVSYFLMNKLPSEAVIDSRLQSQPIQTETDILPFDVTVENLSYHVEPLYKYDLYGLIAAQNDNEVWFSRFRETDPLNTKDICVLYGKNLKSNILNKYVFKSDEFQCSAKAKEERVKKADIIQGEDISNNRLLASPVTSPVFYETVRKAKVGDQIHLRGVLVKYSVLEDGEKIGGRESSVVRSDVGNSASEAIYLTDFSIMKEGNPTISDLYQFSVVILIGSVIVYVVSMLLPYQPYSSNFLSD